jgi:hypothetical protein
VTRIQVHFHLDGPLSDKQYLQIRAAKAVYGIQHISLSPSLDRIMVEYDATRFSPLDVESVLRSHSLPIRPVVDSVKKETGAPDAPFPA